MQFTRRRLLSTAAFSLGTGLLAACSSNPPPAATSGAPTVPPTQPAALASVAAVTPPTAAPAPAKPSGQPSPSASPGVVAAPSAAPAASPAPAAASPAPAAVAAAPFRGKQMYQQDAQHSGGSPFAGPRQASVLRRFDMGAPGNIPSDAAIPRADVQSTSVVGPDGTTYVANFAGVLWALRDSPSTRDQLEAAWRFHPPAATSLHATPALSSDGGTVYLGFSSGLQGSGMATLYALKTADGQTLWSADLGATRVMASPTVGPDGTIYIGTAGGQLFAIGSNGSVKWTAQTGPTIKSAPALATDGTVYEASSDDHLYAVSPQGQVKWSFVFGEHLGPTPLFVPSGTPPVGTPAGRDPDVGSGASPTVGADGTIFIGASNSNMYAVRPDGNLKWLFEAEREIAGIWTTPALSADGSTMYFGANKGGVYALNTGDGSKRWQVPVYGSIYASSVLDSRGVLYTGSTVEHLFAIDSATGEQIWDLDIHNSVWSAPSIRPDGTLVIADRGGIVQVIG